MINPVVKPSASATEDYSPIVFQFGGPRPFSFVVESPSGSVSGSNPGWAAPFSIVEVPAINGDYKVTVTNSCECNTNVDYNVTWLDPNGYTNRLAGYNMWISMGAVRVDSFKFNRIPPPPPQEELMIKINLTGQKEIWPSLPKGQSNINGYNPITNAIIRVTKGTQPQANQNVKISVKRIEGTGGHDHLNPLPLDKCGIIKVGGFNGNPISTTTNQNGEIITDEILSSQVSGKYIIEAVLEQNNNLNDTTSLIVRVPGLVDFRSILSDEWYLIGCLPAHKINHFCKEEMGLWLASAIMDFYEWDIEYSKQVNKEPHKILVNDMSLIWGGVFDYPGKWNLNKEHQFHRIGFSVDISRADSGISDYEINRLTNIITSSYNGKRDSERPQIHYEFKGGYYK